MLACVDLSQAGVLVCGGTGDAGAAALMQQMVRQR